MKRVFVDTNVILDVLLQRYDVWQDSLKIFRLAELGKIKAYISASSMTDIFYVANKKLSPTIARQAIETLLNLFDVVGVDGEDLRGALSVPVDDYEDALQVYCACKINADVLVTRDIEGFHNIDIIVLPPISFSLD